MEINIKDFVAKMETISGNPRHAIINLMTLYAQSEDGTVFVFNKNRRIPFDLYDYWFEAALTEIMKDNERLYII